MSAVLGLRNPGLALMLATRFRFILWKKMTRQKQREKSNSKKKKFWEMSKPKGGSAAGRADMEWSHEQALSVRPRAGHAALPDTGWEG